MSKAANLSWLISPLVAATLLLGVAHPANAALITFNTRGAFDLAAPALPVETFESALVLPDMATSCIGPLSSTAGSACFPLGSLLPGVTYSAVPGPFMVVLPAGFGSVENTSKVLGPDTFAHTFDLTFASANAIGFDVFPGFLPGSVTISVFDALNSLLGSFVVFGPTGGTFFGVISDAGAIGRLNITSSVGGELVDNLAFGTAPAAVPEPASLLLLGTGIAGIVAKVRRRRKQQAQ